MMHSPQFQSHAQQQAVLGSAAELDPDRNPRRYALMQARKKLSKRSSTQSAAEEYNDRVAERQAEREEIARRAMWYSDLTAREAAKAMGVSYEKLRKIRVEFGLTFKSAMPAKE